MQATFVHTADNHLGYEQYGMEQRFDDFARAFFSVIDDAIARHADFVIIAGDLFNKRAIDARTLIQAQTALMKLRDAGITAIAIEGNHDRSYYRDGVSWLQFLSWQKLLILFNPFVQNGAPEITAWDGEAMRGAYVDAVVSPSGERLRVYGLPWYGASTARVMESFAQSLAERRAEEDAEGVAYRLLVMHTGVEGIVPQLHGLPTRAQFEPLRGLVDYVALGHVHKQYCLEDWLYNPGSTETWGAEESAWDRGYYAVTVDTDVAPGEPKQHAQHVTNPRRPFVRIPFKADGLSNPQMFNDAFERRCRMVASEHGYDVPDREPPGGAPVVDVTLSGVMSFESNDLDRKWLEECVNRHFRPLTVRIRDTTRDNEYDTLDDDALDGRDRSTWRELEVHIFQEMVARDARYAANAPQWARVLAELKTMALNADEPAAIALRLRDARNELL